METRLSAPDFSLAFRSLRRNVFELPLASFARRMGISRSHLAKLERGERRIMFSAKAALRSLPQQAKQGLDHGDEWSLICLEMVAWARMLGIPPRCVAEMLAPGQDRNPESVHSENVDGDLSRRDPLLTKVKGLSMQSGRRVISVEPALHSAHQRATVASRVPSSRILGAEERD